VRTLLNKQVGHGGAHYNPSYAESKGRRIMVWGWPWAKINK
jgi:hypothetical protein